MSDDLKSLAKKLRLLSGPEFSQATAATLNRITSGVNGGQRINIKREFTLRNKFTLGSLMVFKATPKADANKINSLVGSKSPYLDDHEGGGTPKTRRGKDAVAMPSKASRRGNWGRPITARARMDKIRVIGHRGRDGRMTPRGTPYFFLEGGRMKNKTLFERRGRRLVRLRVITKGPVHFKASHWHTEATGKYGRPALVSAAYQVELARGLTKLGAR